MRMRLRTRHAETLAKGNQHVSAKETFPAAMYRLFAGTLTRFYLNQEHCYNLSRKYLIVHLLRYLRKYRNLRKFVCYWKTTARLIHLNEKNEKHQVMQILCK